tara:strand:- start:56 stop:331 length:276 start_codon:yes stop_codon:yes gene_type:complete
MDMNEVKTLDITQKKRHPNELLKEIVELSFEKKPGKRIHKKELESYVCTYYYNETRKEIKCSKDDLYKLMNDKYGKNEHGYWKDLSFKYFE